MIIPHLSDNPATPLDRFRQPLNPGDLVVYVPPVPAVYRVIDVRPDPDARDRGGVLITVQSDQTIRATSGQPGPLHRVGYMGPSGPVLGSPVPGPVGVPDVP